MLIHAIHVQQVYMMRENSAPAAFQLAPQLLTTKNVYTVPARMVQAASRRRDATGTLNPIIGFGASQVLKIDVRDLMGGWHP